MKCLRVWFFQLAWAGALAPMVSPAMLRAQSNPPFQNPALDSNCYFPQIGDPAEMDTIMGSDSNQDLGGSIIKNLGPKPNGGFGNMFIGNLSLTVALAQVTTGPGFNLHQMTPSVQKFDPNIFGGYPVQVGHFRDLAHLDILAGMRIYWADDNGNYDSASYTQLWSHLRGDRNGWIGIIDPFAGYFTSDTVEDIVLSIFTDWVDFAKDTSYLLLYRGGTSLFQKDTAYEDTSCQLFPNLKNFPYREALPGDFRGTGRTDVIIEGRSGSGPIGSNEGDFFFYANDPPFSLEKLAQAINYDTLMAEWQDHLGANTGTLSTFALPVFPKNANDRSVDFAVVAQGDTLSLSIFMFRGGQDFGSHRLATTPDSADFIITHPFGSSYEWPYSIADAGDMTGTGNHVLYTAGAYSVDYQTDNFYVMGQALDNKIDIYNVSNSGSQGDTLTANDDSLEDFLLARARSAVGSDESGTLWLYYGSKKIPVHLNPQWADVKTEIEKIPQQNGAGITLSPNPANNWTVATIVWPEAEEGEYIITDMLGREVQRDQIQFLGGGQENRISFPELPQGAYAVTLVGQHGTATARLIKLAAASGPQAIRPGGFMQSLRDARDGKTSKFPEASSLLR